MLSQFCLDFGMEYLEGLLNVIPAETGLLSLQELYDVLENCQELQYLVYEWKFVRVRNPIYYESTELPEGLDVWQRLYEDKNKSVIDKSVCDTLDFNYDCL